MNDETRNQETNTPVRRAWLAALLLREPDGFLARFVAGAARWRMLSRNTRRRAGRRLAATAAGAALALTLVAGPLAPAAYAATITVDDGMVVVADDGQCSLREAIISANTDAQVFVTAGECDAGSGADLITLPVDGDFLLPDGTYYVVPFPSGLPVIYSDLTIDGNGSTIRRDTADPDQFTIMTIAAEEVEINDVTITGGSGAYGGGILTLYGADLTISGSTISGNEAYAFGGGLFAYASDILINASTISGNHAEFSGGGLSLGSSNFYIVNSTVSGNSAQYAAGVDAGVFFISTLNTGAIINSTITDNSATSFVGGLVVGEESDVTLSRSIISGNRSGAIAGAEVYVISGGIVTADDYNVFGHAGLTDYAAFAFFTPGASDYNASSDAADIPLSAILDPTLKDNGGPTRTHNLAAYSPALDFAPDADCVPPSPTDGVDQRGAARPFDVVGQNNEGSDTCDAGAVEAEAPFVGEADVFMSTTIAGTTGDGLDFGPEDIIRWDGEEWSLFFDGSVAGLEPFNARHNISAFWIPDPEEGDFIFSFAQNRRHVPGLPNPVDGMDLVYWNALTEEFSLYLDGSDVGLTNKTQEKIDGLHGFEGSASPINGGNCLAYLLVSTQGPGKVPNYSGGTLKFSGEDVLGFCATELGENTQGYWHMVLDGSTQGMPKNSTGDFSLSDDGQTLYLTTKGTFNVDSAVGGHSMVYTYDFGTQTFSGPLFIAADEGLAQKVDGLHVEGDLP